MLLCVSIAEEPESKLKVAAFKHVPYGSLVLP
jgi:hypothetical protein